VVELPGTEEPAGCADLFHCPDWPCDEPVLPTPAPELLELEPAVLSRFHELDWPPVLCCDGCVVALPGNDEPAGCALFRFCPWPWP
jgi:hypothetical protein